MNNTILSIDLDIIFSPYVGIYNKFIENNIPCESIWQNIQEIYSINDFEPNQQYLNLIIEIIKNYQNQINKIYIGEDHSNILEAIEKEKNNFLLPYKFDIYNIDYHHDIFYTEQQGQRIAEHRIADCGSWVGYLTYFDYINKYYWYCGKGSEVEENRLMESNEHAVPQTEKILFNSFPQNLNIDLLYISLSWPWIPINHYDIIKNIIDIIPNEKIVFLKYPFFYNRQKQNFLNNIGEQYYYYLDQLYKSK